jgi:hypothetical protein
LKSERTKLQAEKKNNPLERFKKKKKKQRQRQRQGRDRPSANIACLTRLTDLAVCTGERTEGF